MGLDVPVAVIPPGLEVIVYVSAYKDGVNETDAEPEEGAAIRFLGAAGIGLTNTGDDVIEGDVLDVLLPVSVKVYVVPFVNPVTKIGLTNPVAIILPGDEITL